MTKTIYILIEFLFPKKAWRVDVSAVYYRGDEFTVRKWGRLTGRMFARDGRNSKWIENGEMPSAMWLI